MRRLGLLGGSFDPVHLAHLLVAERVGEALALDRVLLVPAGRQPLKREGPVAPAADRLEMVRLATRDNPRLEPSALELERPGASYTVDTLLELRGREPRGEIFLILGSDAYRLTSAWHRFGEVRRLARVVVVPRAATPAGGDASAAEPVAGEPLRVEVPRLDISASEIRSRVAAGASIRYLVPEPVREHILTRRLYGAP